MIRRKCWVVKGRQRDGAGLYDEEDDAPRGDERHEEQAAQHAEPERFLTRVAPCAPGRSRRRSPSARLDPTPRWF